MDELSLARHLAAQQKTEQPKLEDKWRPGLPAAPYIPWLGKGESMKNGDYVTRGGDDVHRVQDLTPDQYAAEFVCVVAPASGWCKVGDVEYNLARRYAVLSADDPLLQGLDA